MNSEEFSLKNKRIIVTGLVSYKIKNLDEKFSEIETYIEKNSGICLHFFVQRRGVSRSKKVGGSKKLKLPLTSKYFIGKGKAKQLKELAILSKCNLIIFLNDLRFSQTKRFRNLCKCPVICLSELKNEFSILKEL